jgi:hypothetical protein
MLVCFFCRLFLFVCSIGCTTVRSAFYAADRQERRAEKVNKLSSRIPFKISMKQYGN